MRHRLEKSPETRLLICDRSKPNRNVISGRDLKVRHNSTNVLYDAAAVIWR